MVSLLFAHPEPITYYFLYGAAGILIVVSGCIVLFAGRFLVGVIRPAALRKPATTSAGRAVETLEASMWGIAGLLIWYWLASAVVISLGLTR